MVVVCTMYDQDEFMRDLPCWWPLQLDQSSAQWSSNWNPSFPSCNCNLKSYRQISDTAEHHWSSTRADVKFKNLIMHLAGTETRKYSHTTLVKNWRERFLVPCVDKKTVDLQHCTDFLDSEHLNWNNYYWPANWLRAVGQNTRKLTTFINHKYDRSDKISQSSFLCCCLGTMWW